MAVGGTAGAVERVSGVTAATVGDAAGVVTGAITTEGGSGAAAMVPEATAVDAVAGLLRVGAGVAASTSGEAAGIVAGAAAVVAAAGSVTGESCTAAKARTGTVAAVLVRTGAGRSALESDLWCVLRIVWPLKSKFVA